MAIDINNILKKRVVEEDGEGWRLGRVERHEVDSFIIRFDDGNEVKYSLERTVDIIIEGTLPDKFYGKRGLWTKVKMKYNFISELLKQASRSSCSLFTLCTDEVIALLFDYKANQSGRAAINSSELRKRLNLMKKIIHPDKTVNQPEKMRYAATQLMIALDYIIDQFHLKVFEEGRVKNTSTPLMAHYPRYGTEEFRRAASLSQMEHLSQDSEDGEPTISDASSEVDQNGSNARRNGDQDEQGGQSNEDNGEQHSRRVPGTGRNRDGRSYNSSNRRNYGGRGNNIASPQHDFNRDNNQHQRNQQANPDQPITFDRYGRDVPYEPINLNMRGAGGILPDEWASMDALDLHQVNLSIVSQVKIVPKGAMGLWALSYRKAASKLADAMELGMDDHNRAVEVRRAFGWYSILPQLLLRNHNINGERATKVITDRCNQFLNDKYGTLIKHWEDDSAKVLKKKNYTTQT